MEKKIIRIVDYCEYPGPRYCDQGDYSGEDFYHNVLNNEFYNALNSNIKLIIDLDNTAGYASSFLDEAFGNLVFDFTKDKVIQFVEIKSNEEPDWITMIENNVYSDWETRRKQNKKPKITISHPKRKQL